MKKVIVRLGNGLGNQLFTYAAAYSFAKKNNAKLFVDDESGFYKRYKYELHSFNISAPIIEKKYKFLGFFGRIKRKILIKLSKLNSHTKFLIEESITEIPNFNDDQARYIETVHSVNSKVIRISNIYLPNGNPYPGDKFDYKLNWMKALKEHLI